jgi:pimeloyl-ACP methyl ester carboxylesterase
MSSRLSATSRAPVWRTAFLPPEGTSIVESSPWLIARVARRGMPDDIPRTWILTLRDRALAPKLQRKYIESLGGVQTLIPIDTSHMVMVSEPELLAEILVQRCRLYE